MPIPGGTKDLIRQNRKDVTRLELQNFGLNDNDMEELVSLIAANKYIKFLSLFRNNITSIGVQQLAKLTNIEALYVGSNSIGDQGARALVQNPAFKTLGLNNIGLSNAGAQFIAEHASQTSINIANNRRVDSIWFVEISKKVRCNFRASPEGQNVSEIPSFREIQIASLFRDEHNLQEAKIEAEETPSVTIPGIT